MNINQLLGSSAAAQGTVSAPKKELGQDDFLKLLVAQMKNQDPSNPADNGEFLSQIAQFSMVSGIDNLGTSFNGVANGFYSTQAMQASELVGHQVLSESDIIVHSEGAPAEGVIEVPELTNGLNIQVRDIRGNLVKTLDTATFRTGLNNFVWDGTNDKGVTLPSGDYVVRATGLVDGTQQGLPVQLYNTVESVSVNRATNSVELQLASNERINFSQVTQYR